LVAAAALASMPRAGEGGTMGLLDEVVSHVSAQSGTDASHAAMAQAVVALLARQDSGGPPGMLQSFQSKGLGDAVSSWVGTTGNQAVSPDQVHAALGADTIAQLAQKAGLSPEMAKTVLATVLPLVIDKLTPQGQVPQENLLSEGLGLLRKFV
jgi:uncharacterized protein YidB (DUF937 family)